VSVKIETQVEYQVVTKKKNQEISREYYVLIKKNIVQHCWRNSI